VSTYFRTRQAANRICLEKKKGTELGRRMDKEEAWTAEYRLKQDTAALKQLG